MNDEEIVEVVTKVLEVQLELQSKALKQMTGRPDRKPVGAPGRRRRRQSLVSLSIEVLTEAGRPMHVSELVDELRRRFGRVTDRDALSSALAKKARRRELLRQTAKATFDLLGEDQEEQP